MYYKTLKLTKRTKENLSKAAKKTSEMFSKKDFQYFEMGNYLTICGKDKFEYSLMYFGENAQYLFLLDGLAQTVYEAIKESLID